MDPWTIFQESLFVGREQEIQEISFGQMPQIPENEY